MSLLDSAAYVAEGLPPSGAAKCAVKRIGFGDPNYLKKIPNGRSYGTNAESAVES